MTDSKDNNETPVTPTVFFLDTGKPSLYHLTTGRGMPVASQSKVTLLPGETLISFTGLIVKLGGAGAKMKTWSVKTVVLRLIKAFIDL